MTPGRMGSKADVHHAAAGEYSEKELELRKENRGVDVRPRCTALVIRSPALELFREGFRRDKCLCKADADGRWPRADGKRKPPALRARIVAKHAVNRLHARHQLIEQLRDRAHARCDILSDDEIEVRDEHMALSA